jgi:hypothetical protein
MVELIIVTNMTSNSPLNASRIWRWLIGALPGDVVLGDVVLAGPGPGPAFRAAVVMVLVLTAGSCSLAVLVVAAVPPQTSAGSRSERQIWLE